MIINQLCDAFNGKFPLMIPLEVNDTASPDIQRRGHQILNEFVSGCRDIFCTLAKTAQKFDIGVAGTQDLLDESRIVPELCSLPYADSIFEVQLLSDDTTNIGHVILFAGQDRDISEIADKETIWKCSGFYKAKGHDRWDMLPYMGEVIRNEATGAAFGVSVLDIFDHEEFSIESPLRHTPSEELKRYWKFVMLGAVYQVVSFLHLLSCSNIKSEKVTPNQKQIRAKIKHGKCPPFEYHILKLGNDTDTYRSEIKTLHHASPRFHFRRGHIRRLSNDKVTCRMIR